MKKKMKIIIIKKCKNPQDKRTTKNDVVPKDINTNKEINNENKEEEDKKNIDTTKEDTKNQKI